MQGRGRKVDRRSTVGLIVEDEPRGRNPTATIRPSGRRPGGERAAVRRQELVARRRATPSRSRRSAATQPGQLREAAGPEQHRAHPRLRGAAAATSAVVRSPASMRTNERSTIDPGLVPSREPGERGLVADDLGVAAARRARRRSMAAPRSASATDGCDASRPARRGRGAAAPTIDGDDGERRPVPRHEERGGRHDHGEVLEEQRRVQTSTTSTLGAEPEPQRDRRGRGRVGRGAAAARPRRHTRVTSAASREHREHAVVAGAPRRATKERLRRHVQVLAHEPGAGRRTGPTPSVSPHGSGERRRPSRPRRPTTASARRQPAAAPDQPQHRERRRARRRGS